MRFTIFFAAITLALGSGLLARCTTVGYDAGPVAPLNGVAQTNDAVVSANLAKRPQLQFPFRMAVYVLPEDGPGALDSRDRAALIGMSADLQRAGVVSTMHFISNSILKLEGRVEGSEPEADRVLHARRLAARYGADTVLIVQGQSRMQSYANGLSLLYLTLAGVWMVPGSHRDHTYVLETSLWDVRNGYLYASTETDVSSETLRPYGWLNEADIVEADRRKAIAELLVELAPHIEHLK